MDMMTFPDHHANRGQIHVFDQSAEENDLPDIGKSNECQRSSLMAVLASVRFVGSHKECGRTDHYTRGRRYLTQYAKEHRKHGCQRVFDTETGEHVRTEYEDSHPNHGEVRWFEKGRHVRSTWQNHPNADRVAYMNQNQVLERYEFHSGTREGHIVYFTGGDNWRLSVSGDSRSRARVERTEFKEHHRMHGVVLWQTALGRVHLISYSKTHVCTGILLHYDATQLLSHLTFAPGDERCGQKLVWVWKSGGVSLSHVEYCAGHPLHGQTNPIAHKDRQHFGRLIRCKTIEKDAACIDTSSVAGAACTGPSSFFARSMIQEACESENAFKRAFGFTAAEMIPSFTATDVLRLLHRGVVCAPELEFPRATACSQLLNPELTTDDGLGIGIRRCWLLVPVLVGPTEPIDAAIASHLHNQHPDYARAREELYLFRGIRNALKEGIERDYERKEQSRQRQEALAAANSAREMQRHELFRERKLMQLRADAEHNAKRQAEARAESERMEARRAEIAQREREQELAENDAKATANAAARVARAEEKLKQMLDQMKASEFNTAAGKARTAAGHKGKHKAQTPAVLTRSAEQQREHVRRVDPKERKALEAVAEAKKLLAAAEKVQREHAEKAAHDKAERLRREARAVEAEHRPPAAAAVGAVLAEATARATPLGKAVAGM